MHKYINIVMKEQLMMSTIFYHKSSIFYQINMLNNISDDINIILSKYKYYIYSSFISDITNHTFIR